MSFRNGIQRYDGTHFQNFFTGKGVLPAGLVTTMSMDQKGRLWVITNHTEAGYFDTDKFIYHSVKINLPVAFDNTGTGLNFGDGSNIMLIYVGRGFLTFNEKTNEFSQQYNLFNLPAGLEPKHIVYDGDDNYWIATPNGFVKYNTKKKLLSYAGHNLENDPFINAFAFVKNCGVIYTDQLKRVWVTYRNPGYAIRSFNPVNGEIKSWEMANGTLVDLWGINQFSDGSLWMNGPGLLAKVNYEQHRIEPVVTNTASEYGIRYDVAGSLFEDREKSIWVCTNNGLYRFNPPAHLFHAIQNREVKSDKSYSIDVTGVLETRDGEILISTWGEGIFSYDNNFNPVVSKYLHRKKDKEVMVWCMLQAKNGDIWRGGADGILYIYDAATKKTVRLSPEVCNNRAILQLAEDKDGNIWLGTQGGQLIKWNRSDKQFRLQQLFKNSISRLYVDSQNNIWVCTLLDGVFLIKSDNGSILAHYTGKGPANKKLLINGAADVIQYDDTTMIIASNGINILNTKTGSFTYLDEGSEISSLLKDKNGLLWFSTSAGIVSRNLAKKNIIVSFDAKDGINNTNFHAASGTLLSNGDIVFGTSHDFLTFTPVRALAFSLSLPEVQIARIASMGKPLSVDSIRNLGKLHAGPDENSLSFYFTTNTFQNLFSIYYKLENEDKEWKETKGDLSLNYLPPGNYTLKVTAKDANGKNGKVLSLQISVAAPFYRTWWFYAMIALAVGILLFLLDRERIKRREVVQKMRTDIAGNLHQEINNTLQSINILSEMAKIKADKDIDKSKEFIEQIHGKSHNMIVAMDDMLWWVDPANDSMDKTILRMQEFIDAINNSHEAHVNLLVDEKIQQLNLSMQLRHDAFLLFRETIRKIITAGIKECKVHITRKKNTILFTVKCSNELCNLPQIKGLWQSLEMEHRLKNLGATVHTEVNKSNTILLVKVPV